MNKREPSLRVRLGVRLGNVLGELDRIKFERPPARPRSWLCRRGLHRWTCWDLRSRDFRTLESRCKRGCGARRVMVYKHGEADSTEALGGRLSRRLRRDLWDGRLERSRRGSKRESSRR